MSAHHSYTRADGSVVEITITEPSDGDFHIDAEPTALRARRARVMNGDWAVAKQVHGANVFDASMCGASDPAVEADAVMTSVVEQPIAVQGADCAPLAFITDQGPIAVAHAGWRGLAAGVVQSVVDALNVEGAAVNTVVVGPVIGTECYEFGDADLDHVAGILGDQVRGATADGASALDMKAAINLSCVLAGITDVQFVSPCTACGGGGFSHRARKDTQRHAMVARLRDPLSDAGASMDSGAAL